LYSALTNISEQDPLVNLARNQEGKISIRIYGEVQKEIIQAFSPELCCSSVANNDPHNRFQGRELGVVILNGEITSASTSDAFTTSRDGQRYHRQTNTFLREDIKNTITGRKNNIVFNEITIQFPEQPLILPYIDLDANLARTKINDGGSTESWNLSLQELAQIIDLENTTTTLSMQNGQYHCCVFDVVSNKYKIGPSINSIKDEELLLLPNSDRKRIEKIKATQSEFSNNITELGYPPIGLYRGKYYKL